MNFIELPVSFGEALDKLSILEIKLEKIKDDRRKDVLVEHTTLLEKLKELFTNDAKYQYGILKDINLAIWEMQDIFRDSATETEKVSLAMKIIDENDRRFRLKAKLNTLFSSKLREQKGYVRRRAFLLGHIELGDCFTISPAARYLSTIYEEVTVVVYKKFYDNVALLYKDDPTIKLYPVDSYNSISPNHGFPREEFAKITAGYDSVYVCGHLMFEKPWHPTQYVPFCFYKDIGIPTSVYWNYFHAPDSVESVTLYEKAKSNGKPYIITHTGTSGGQLFTFEHIEEKLGISRNDVLFIDINTNAYPVGSPNYELAAEFINKPVIHYKDLLINADYVWVSDSCLFCLAMQLPIQTKDCYITKRGCLKLDHLYDTSDGFSEGSGKRKFKFRPANI